jgi:serine/threonine protein phosphatase 1
MAWVNSRGMQVPYALPYLIIGDIVDGGRYTRECIDLLLMVRNKIFIKGNHDEWALKWMKSNIELPAWVHQGGYNTMLSYGFDNTNVPRSHIDFLDSGVSYYIDPGNRIYVHGGFDPDKRIEYQDPEFLTWDRGIISYAMLKPIPGYKHVFIGHTTTQLIEKGVTSPLTFHNLTMCDCGGGWNGQLAMINVEDLSYVLSDKQIPNGGGDW